MTKHWFHAHLMQKFTSSKKLGVDLGYGLGNWDEFKQCPFVTLDKTKEGKPDIISNFNHNLPFKDDIFDVAICFSVLDKVQNYEKFLLEIKRVLKKDKYLICIIPHEKWDQDFLNKVVKEADFKSIIHKHIKEWFFATYFNLTSVYSYAILQNKK